MKEKLSIVFPNITFVIRKTINNTKEVNKHIQFPIASMEEMLFYERLSFQVVIVIEKIQR